MYVIMWLRLISTWKTIKYIYMVKLKLETKIIKCKIFPFSIYVNQNFILSVNENMFPICDSKYDPFL